MIREIFTYIAKREAYNQYLGFKNSTADVQLKILNNTLKTLLYLIWAAFCISFGYQVSATEGLALFFLPVSFFKIISGIHLITRRNAPVYTPRPVHKSDRRFKTGSRVSHFEQVLSGKRPLNEIELEAVKKTGKYKIIFWCIALASALGILTYTTYFHNQ